MREERLTGGYYPRSFGIVMLLPVGVAGQEHTRREHKERAEVKESKREISRKRTRRNETSATLVILTTNKPR
jgi:hypothetical protein